jgi:WD40 repeat protein
MLRRIFLRLVAIGDDTPDAKRRVSPDELTAGDDPDAGAALLDRLAQARLVTIDDGSVQLAHEALIRFWPRLADWLGESRDGLRVQRRASDAATEWARLGRDPAALYRGTPLAVAQAWAERDAHLTGLTHVEQEFLDASSAAEVAGRGAAIRAASRLRKLVASLAVLLLAVSVSGGLAVWQRETALSVQRDATSGQLAALSAALASANPDAAALAALAAWDAKPTVAARSALLSTAACCTSTQASLRGEHATVSAVALSPDGSLLAAGGQDRTVHLWHTADGRQLDVLHGFADQVSAVAFSPTGSLLAAGSADHTIRLWEPARGTALGSLSGDSGAIEDLAFSPSGRLLASAAADGRIRLWNPVTHQLVWVLHADRSGPMLSVAFSPDGSILAGAGDDHAVTLWTISGVAPPHIVRVLTGAIGAITNLAYSPNGTLIAGEESGGDVLLWNLDQGSRKLLRDAAVNSRGLAFSRDGTVLLTAGSYYSVPLWNTATGRQVAYDVHRIPDGTLALAYNPDSGLLALGGLGGAIQIWQEPIPPFTGSASPVTGLAVITRPTMIASVSSDNRLSLWSRRGVLVATTGLAVEPAAIAVSPDGKELAIMGADGTLTFRDIPRLTFAGQLHIPRPAVDVAFSPDGSMLATADRGTISVWDARRRTRDWFRYSSHGFFGAVAFAPGGSDLAAATSMGSVVIWNARTGRRIAEVNPVTGSVNAVAFSPSGRFLATAGNDGNITLWNSANLHRLAAHAGPVGATRALAFTPDGSTLISGDSSNRIVAWDLNPQEVIREDCQTLASDPGLSQAETLVPGISYPQLCPDRQASAQKSGPER